MKKHQMIITALVAALALSIVPVFAQGFGGHARMHGMQGMQGMQAGPGGHGGGMFLFGRLGHLRQALNLTDDQVTQLKAIGQDLRTQNQPYRDQLRGGMQSVMQTLLADPNNVAGAQSLIEQQTSAHKAMQTNMLNAASKGLSVLTADQRAKLADFLAKRAAKSQAK